MLYFFRKKILNLKSMATFCFVFNVIGPASASEFSQENILVDQLGKFRLPGIVSPDTQVRFGLVAGGHIDDPDTESIVVQVSIPSSGVQHVMRLRDGLGVDLIVQGRFLLDVLDVDGDGYDDVLSCDPTSPQLSMFLWRGPLALNNDTAITVNGSGAPATSCTGGGLAVSSFDVDKDGLQDLLINFRDSLDFLDKSMLLRNSGAQTFFAHNLPVFSVFAIGDIDGNGLLDVMGESSTLGTSAVVNNVASVTESVSAITLNTQTFPFVGMVGSGSITRLADANKNGLNDFIFLRDSGGFVSGCCSLYEHLGGNDFRETKLDNTDNGSNQFGYADVDGDGTPDIISGSERADSKLARILSASIGGVGFESEFIAHGDIESRLNLGAVSPPLAIDYDGDGDTDLVISQSSSRSSLSTMTSDEKIYLLRQNQKPRLTGTPVETVNVSAKYSFSPEASDGDGDSLLFYLDNAPSWLAIDSSTGIVTGIAPANLTTSNYNGIVIRADDQRGAQNSAAQLGPFSIAVQALNTNPGGVPTPTPTPVTPATPAPSPAVEPASGGGGALGIFSLVLLGFIGFALRGKKRCHFWFD